MKSYNGFDAKQRYRALAYHKEQISLGNKPPKPECCHACGQTEGVLVWHSENYSEPFGDHIGEHGLCYVCHMMIHCRFRNPRAWRYHIGQVSRGMMPEPMYSQNWKAFLQTHLIRAGTATYTKGNVQTDSFVFSLS